MKRQAPEYEEESDIALREVIDKVVMAMQEAEEKAARERSTNRKPQP